MGNTPGGEQHGDGAATTSAAAATASAATSSSAHASPALKPADSATHNAKQDKSKSPKMSPSSGSSNGGGDIAEIPIIAGPGPKVTLEDFELLSVVGRGSFGKVFQVKKKDTGKIYAMKALKKKALVARKQVAHTKTERRVLQAINHPFIVSLRFAFQTDTKLYMVTDFFNGGELFFHLKNSGRFDEERTVFYAAQIVCALEHLHEKNIIYRDLKPENILLDDQGFVKLTDFGLSKEVEGRDGLTTTFCGTPEYLAPEVLHGNGYGIPIDWWSLGALLFEMLTGLPPYYDENVNAMYEKILHTQPNYPSYLSAKSKSVISRLLEKDQTKRLGYKSGASEVKQDPFFSSIDWDKLVAKEVEPPFKPNVTSPNDLANIDDEFKSETPKDTPVQKSKLADKARFSNFTYDGQEMRTDGAAFNLKSADDDDDDLADIAE
eukprot:TRINITY_DN4690_c0_g1_i2.p1 TRINITY_DN4690_c0_g1~~TRINITY_DN4690_c0_g1_i2.p1  ORF type:complete len:455 (-),score=114.79 TRINITY_DN4690_c0_g1_i2:1390-2694(-)